MPFAPFLKPAWSSSALALLRLNGVGLIAGSDQLPVAGGMIVEPALP